MQLERIPPASSPGALSCCAVSHPSTAACVAPRTRASELEPGDETGILLCSLIFNNVIYKNSIK
jgi:hypothetical protein